MLNPDAVQAGLLALPFTESRHLKKWSAMMAVGRVNHDSEFRLSQTLPSCHAHYSCRFKGVRWEQDTTAAYIFLHINFPLISQVKCHFNKFLDPLRFSTRSKEVMAAGKEAVISKGSADLSPDLKNSLNRRKSYGG